MLTILKIQIQTVIMWNGTRGIKKFCTGIESLSSPSTGNMSTSQCCDDVRRWRVHWASSAAGDDAERCCWRRARWCGRTGPTPAACWTASNLPLSSGAKFDLLLTGAESETAANESSQKACTSTINVRCVTLFVTTRECDIVMRSVTSVCLCACASVQFGL